MSTQGQNILAQLREKNWELAYLVESTTSCGQLCKPVPTQCGGSPRVLVLAQEMDGLVVLQGDGTQISSAPEIISATFGQPLVKFFGEVLGGLA